MLLITSTTRGLSPMLIEGGLTTIAVALAFCLPSLGTRSFLAIERAFASLARRRSIAITSVTTAAILLRLALIPFSPVPLPATPVDFSFLLAAKTFRDGRLTNPTPVMWQHLESIHVSFQPTYMSMYFPAQGFVLAVGDVVFGNPWFGNLLITALMCGAICWMLYAWLPPNWALLGGCLAVMRLGLFSYWIDGYSGGGSLSALAGALILGTMPRLLRTSTVGDRVLLGAGAAILLLSRPYEGLLLCIPVVILLCLHNPGDSLLTSRTLIFRHMLLPFAMLLAAGSWLAFYDRQVFGNAFVLPYTLNRATYAMAPYYIWQSPRPEPNYRHAVMRDFYYRHELAEYRTIHSSAGLIQTTLLKPLSALVFYAGIALLPPLIMLRRVLIDRRTRFLVLSVLVLAVGMSIENFFLPHYLAAFTAAFYAIGLQATRHLRLWRPGGNPVGLTMVRLIVSICVLLTAVRAFAAPFHLLLPVFPATSLRAWYGSGRSGMARAQIERLLNASPGKNLVIVRYAPSHDSFDEWVYNEPNLDKSKTIWAREMDSANNFALICFYKDRKVWLVQPDLRTPAITPYDLSGNQISDNHSNASGLLSKQFNDSLEAKP